MREKTNGFRKTYGNEIHGFATKNVACPLPDRYGGERPLGTAVTMGFQYDIREERVSMTGDFGVVEEEEVAAAGR